MNGSECSGGSGRLRIALVCDDLASDRAIGLGARCHALGSTLSRAGHEVLLISAELSAARRAATTAEAAPEWVPLAAARPGHRYLTEQHAYSDRVFDTLRSLHADRPLDAVEFADGPAAALTTLRARRVLSDFRGTVIAITVRPAALRERALDRATTFESLLDEWAADECHAAADLLVTECAAVARQMDSALLRPLPPPPDELRTLRRKSRRRERLTLHLGTETREPGFETFLRAAGLVLTEDPRCRFVLLGSEASDCLAALRTSVAPALLAAIRCKGPLTIPGLSLLPPAGTPCVLPAGLLESPWTAQLAVALDFTVIARDGSSAAAAIDDGSTAVMVPDEPEPLAAAVLAAQHAVPARRAPPVRPHVDRAEALASPYRRSQPRRTLVSRLNEPPLVSAIIALDDRRIGLARTLDSIRGCGYGPIELVVAHDGSGGNPKTMPRQAILAQAREPGIAAARNAGIALARGAFVLLLDAGDCVAPGFVAAAVRAIQASSRIAYVGGYVRCAGGDGHVHATIGYVGGLSIAVNTYADVTALLRREAIESIGAYDVQSVEGVAWDLYLRLHAAGYEGEMLPIEAHVRHGPCRPVGSAARQQLLRRHRHLLSSADAAELLLALAARAGEVEPA